MLNRFLSALMFVYDRHCICWGFLCSLLAIMDVVKVSVTQLCPTLGDPMDCSPPGSSVHGTLQARILEWVAIAFSGGSSRPRDGTQVFCIADNSLPPEP